MALRHALRRDLPAIGELYIDAFAGDPFLRWVQPDDEKWPAFGAAWFGFIVGLAFERGHTYVDDHVDVATAWIAPDLALVTPDDFTHAVSLLHEHAGEQRGADAVATIVQAREHSIDDPHWVLQYIGVRPRRHGHGLGAAAVAGVLGWCDDDRRACSLVSTNPRNVSFYERLGFRVAAEVPTPDGAAVLRPMLRPTST